MAIMGSSQWLNMQLGSLLSVSLFGLVSASACCLLPLASLGAASGTLPLRLRHCVQYSGAADLPCALGSSLSLWTHLWLCGRALGGARSPSDLTPGSRWWSERDLPCSVAHKVQDTYTLLFVFSLGRYVAELLLGGY